MGARAAGEKVTSLGRVGVRRLLVVATLLISCVLPVASSGPASAAITLDSFVATNTGRQLANVQGGYAGECVSLVAQYLHQVHGITPGAWGNAVDYRSGGSGGNQLQSRGFTWSPAQDFQNGDIVVWGNDAGAWTGPAGHIAVWYNGRIFNQNYAGRRTAGLDPFFSPGYLGRWRRAGGTSSSNPTGSFDELTSPEPGAVRVRGWAFDTDARTTPVNVHVYLGGPAGSPAAAGVDIGPAAGSRPDVGRAYPGVGDSHGFDVTLETTKTGPVPVYVYAINAGGTGGGNQLLGTRTVTVQSGNPTGSFDRATSTIPGKVRVSGWAVDPSARTKPVGMHLYVGGPAGSPSAVGYDIGLAGDVRSDVGAAFPGVGDRHGYERHIAIRQSGELDVYLYALDLAGTPGHNVLLGSKRVTVLPAPQPMTSTSAARLTGRARAGFTLAAVGGSWSQSEVSLSYRWLRSGERVKGATRRSYRLTKADVGHRMRVRVTAVKDGYTSATSQSPRSRIVAPRR